MCGRYEFSLGVAPLLDRVAAQEEDWQPGEVRPGMDAPVLIARGGKIGVQMQNWGFVREARRMINARAETAHEKPMFRDCLRLRRCAIPASSFFEWDSARHPYRFDTGRAIFLAGIYEETAGGRFYCILTTAASTCMEAIHDRMPVVLEEGEMRTWLNDPTRAIKLLRAPGKILRRTALDGQLTLW